MNAELSEQLPDQMILWAVLIIGCVITMRLAKRLTWDLYSADQEEDEE
jgi:hypothetical protein